MSNNRKTKASVAEAVVRLQEVVKPGDTLYTILRHVSASGMMRVIDVLKIGTRPDGSPDVRTLAYNANEAGCASGFSDQHDGAKMGGCGMDMAFALVYNIGRACFPDGFGTPCVHCQRRMSPAQRDKARNGHWPKCRARVGSCEFRGRNGDTSGWDEDGGYALNQYRL